MFRLWQRIDRDRRLILTLWVFIGVLLLGCLFLGYGWQQAPQKLTIFVPPDLTQGATFQANTIPKPSVYAFAFYIWQLLNTWPHDGEDDYRSRLDSLWPYVTADFKAQLEADYTRSKQSGLLKRTRQIDAQGTTVYDAERVTQISEGVWHVDLDIRLVETLHGTALKDTVIRYPLRVVRYPTPETYNPWGLAIDGFTDTPQRIINDTTQQDRS